MSAQFRRTRLIVLGALLSAGLSGVLAAQQSLLPPVFEERPAPHPRASASPTPHAAAKTEKAAAHKNTEAVARPTAAASPRSVPAVTAPHVAAPTVAAAPVLPDDTEVTAAPAPRRVDMTGDIDPAVIDQLVRTVQPKFDIPPNAQRSLARLGFLAETDGGLPETSTHYLNSEYVGPLLAKMSGPLVSRWGHILLRRVLVSRLDTPVGMNGADWAALRAQLLLRMGEADAARALVQEVDSGFYTRSLEDAAMASYLATADPIGLCPITALTAAGRPGWDWDLSRSICLAFNGSEGSPALAQLDHALRRNDLARIDVLLAQKFAGAAQTTHRAVQIEWGDVDSLTPWRTGLAFATGIEPPDALRRKDWPGYAVLAGRAPMLPLSSRVAAADVIGGQGVLSSAAMVDLYSEIAALQEPDATWGPLAAQLRTAYVAPETSDRLAAIKALWGDSSDPARLFSRQVLTAYAAARLDPQAALADDAVPLLLSMLSAGLDRNAARWAPYVPLGSQAWGILALGAPAKLAAVGGDVLGTFQSNDSSSGAVRSQLLLAGLMGLGRVDSQTARAFGEKLHIDLGRQTRWSAAIDEAAQSGNPALVAILAAYGMQGSDWHQMTAVNLYHIVGALRQVGLEAEARMIAAEAVARV